VQTRGCGPKKIRKASFAFLLRLISL